MATYSPGEYKITIRGTAGFENPLTADTYVTLLLTNPCPTSILRTYLEPPFRDVSYTIGFKPI